MRNPPALSLFGDIFAKESGQLVHLGYPDGPATIVDILRIVAPRTIILILAVSLVMTPNRDAILFQILQEQKDRNFTVISIRNEILRRDKSIKLDKALLRRWVNGKFVTLVRRGTLSKHKNERGKTYYVITNENENLQIDSVPTRLPPKQRPIVTPALPHEGLKKELSEYRLKAITQMSEMEEYKRIGEVYPDLRSLVTEKFEAAVDENCRVLGKIRALEQLLTTPGSR